MNTARPLLAACAALAALCAVEITPAILRAADAPAAAHVRFWKTDLHDLSRVRVSLRTGAGRHAAAHDLGSAGPGFLFNNYADVPAGHGTLEVFAATDKTPLLSLPADFVPGAFVTVLLNEPQKAGEPPRVEIIEDGGPGVDAPRAQIIMRSFVVGIKEMRVTVGENLNAQFVSGDGFLQMRGLKPAYYPIRTVGTGADDKPFEWTNEADLRQRHHQTLLIYPDPYGRIRPRLIVDGENQAQPPDTKEGQR